MVEFKKVNPKNIKDIDGICTLTDITTSEEVAEFYNNYVVPNNKQKYAAISKNGIVYKYDPVNKKHIKAGVQSATGPRIYAENTQYKQQVKTSETETATKETTKKKETITSDTIPTSNVAKPAYTNIQESMASCIEYLTSLGYTVSLTKNKE